MGVLGPINVFWLSKELCRDVDVSDYFYLGELVVACIVGGDVCDYLVFVGWVGGKW